MRKNILILGAHGMLGWTVFRYFKKNPNFNVYGTIRDSFSSGKTLFKFEVQTFKKDFSQIFTYVEPLSYIINCIALSQNDTKKLSLVNSEFPHMLEDISRAFKCKLFHVSSDAVFSASPDTITEKSIPSPSTKYGESKLLGETISTHALTFRTSLIGLDYYNQKGLLEWAKKSQSIQGYTNWEWSGSTALQFAQLLENIILEDSFKNLRAISHVFHFFPIQTTSKYKILSDFLEISGVKKNIQKAQLEKDVFKRFKSLYENELHFDLFQHNIAKALEELLKFEESDQKK